MKNILFISLCCMFFFSGTSFASENCGLNTGSFGKIDRWFRVYFNADSCPKVSGTKAKVYFRLEQHGATVATSKVYRVSRRNDKKKKLYGEMGDLGEEHQFNLSLFMYAMQNNGSWKMVERHNNLVLIP